MAMTIHPTKNADGMINRAYTQTATYWGSPTSDGLGGQSYGAPIELLVRWEERQEEFLTAEGETEVSNAVVWASQDLDTLGYLYLGVSLVADPTRVTGSFRILQFRSIPAIRGHQFERRAFL